MNKYIINVISKVLLLFVLFNIPIIYAAEPTPAVPPGGISDLTALSGNNEGEVILIWTAPGDDGDDPLGTVSGYSVRYAEVQINDITDFNDFSVKNVKIYSHNWTDFLNGGQVETRTIVSLTDYNGLRLYFALRVARLFIEKNNESKQEIPIDKIQKVVEGLQIKLSDFKNIQTKLTQIDNASSYIRDNIDRLKKDLDEGLNSVKELISA